MPLFRTKKKTDSEHPNLNKDEEEEVKSTSKEIARSEEFNVRF